MRLGTNEQHHHAVNARKAVITITIFNRHHTGVYQVHNTYSTYTINLYGTLEVSHAKQCTSKDKNHLSQS